VVHGGGWCICGFGCDGFCVKCGVCMYVYVLGICASVYRRFKFAESTCGKETIATN